MKRLTPLTITLSLTGLLFLSAQASAQQTPAGTEIVNQAKAEFLSPQGGTPKTSLSNEIRTTVNAVCAVSITPDGTVAQPSQSASLLPGENAVFKYKIVNTGNIENTYPVLGRVETGSSILPGVRVIEDANHNGVFDTGEVEIKNITVGANQTADLLLVVQTTDAQGDGYVNLVTSCAGGAQEDSNNVSVVRVGPPPVLAIDKTFTPSLVKPNTETTVNISTTNDGLGESREVILTDSLIDQVTQGLTFVTGSAQTNIGTIEYTQDGTVWTTKEVLPIRGIRVKVTKLAPRATINLSFRMKAGASAEGKIISNTAIATTNGKTVSDTATADVKYLPAVAIGPIDTPEAPENTSADTQARTFATIGQVFCFDHTLKNIGNVSDAFSLSLTYPKGQANATFYAENGKPLAQPLILEQNQTALVRVCYDAQLSGPFEALIMVKGARGTSNTTRDLIDNVAGGLPELKKSYVASGKTVDGQLTTIAAGGSVGAGNTITYTLQIHNPYASPLTNVVVSDPIPAHLDFVSASDQGTFTTNAVNWNIGTLAPNETRSLTIVTTVSTRAIDGEALKNIFNLVSTELPSPITSNEVQTPVWTAELVIDKQVSNKVATFGDRLTYTLKITNLSKTTAIVDALVTDKPPVGLEYIADTATLEGKTFVNPVNTAGALTWTVASIPANSSILLTYQTRVTPEAVGDLVNNVEVVGSGAGGIARAIASNRATATTKLTPLKFAALADILGMVFIDRNENGLYDKNIDIAVPRARVLLAGGRQVLTDAYGRYSFPMFRKALKLYA